MLKNRLLTALAVLGLFGFAACGGAEEEPTLETQEVITQPGTETVEVQVPTVDTSVVRTEVDIDTDVDTIENPDLEGGVPR